MNSHAPIRIVAFMLAALSLNATLAKAASIVVTEAVLDWSGFSFTTTGGLVIDVLDFAYSPTSSSFAATTLGGTHTAQGIVSVALSSSVGNDGGTALARSSTDNGLLNSRSTSATVGNSPNGRSAPSETHPPRWPSGCTATVRES
jgi:hypothetical protein